MMFRRFFLSLLILTCSTGFAQQEFTIELDWGSEASTVIVDESISFKIPGLKDCYFDGESFLVIRQEELPSNMRWDLSVGDVDYLPTDKLDVSFIEKFNLEVPDEVSFKVKHHKKSGKSIVSVTLNPYVKMGQSVMKIKSASFERNAFNFMQTKNGHVFAQNSVLATGSGDWYKISVNNTAVHKITYEFLKDIGIDIDNIHPNDINIYGNGFGRMPELNSDYRPDDLLKNDIVIVGDADGSFDPGDYILFYARGPHKRALIGQNRFTLDRNIYASKSMYFINVNSGNSPARITNANLSNAAPTNVVTSFDDYVRHEQELVSIIRGGQRWYGELFDAELTQNFSFNIQNLNTNEPVIVRSFMACQIGGGSTNFELKHNGQVIGSTSLGTAGDGSWSRSGISTQPNAFNPSGDNFNISVTFNRNNPSDKAHLDFIEINARRNLIFTGNQMLFSDFQSVGNGAVANFQISNTNSNDVVWEVTNWAKPKLVNGNLSNGVYDFTVNSDSLRTFIAFRGTTNFSAPTFESRVNHQNLHALEARDYLIVTNSLFLNEANRLAALHEANGTTCHVVKLEDIYNEFSGGTQDPTAIKFFAKMFYDRADGDATLMPKYMLLFGDGTYDPLDRVANNNYMCPVYTTLNSENYISSIVSDDYFGFLDDNESFSPDDELDIAVGRLIATTPKHATDLVNKIEHYMKNGSDFYANSGVLCGEDGFISTQGDWRLRYTLIGDDEDNGYFLINDLEPAYNYVEASYPEMNPNKIYLDAFQQISTAGGQRYPDVNREIDRSVDAGTLMMCYVGHGGVAGAAQERVITIGQINDWDNIGKLPLFVSATCEFARIDDPGVVSAGEWMALNPIGGAIALMTTTRAVYFSTNSVTTSRFFRNVFQRDANNMPRAFGDIITDTKNEIPGGTNNKRAFMLLGDPALRIALPYEKAVLDSVNGVDLNLTTDTLRALSKAKMYGHLEDQFGNKLSSFNGLIQPSIFDKKQQQTTLGQDSDSPIINFMQQKNILYRGRVSVVNGEFNFEFIVPKDIDYSFGPGKVSIYGFDDNDMSVAGYNSDIIIGGIDTNGLADNVGPEIEMYLNDDRFVNGGITNQTPILIANLFDESGINTVGTGIGHDITVVLDDQTSNAKVLNDFYEADLDTYKSGSVRYQLEKLEPGLHTLTFKAWDVNNNSSERKIEFTVQEDQDVVINQLLNYPNPFTTSTQFMFEHNQVCASLEVKIEVFTVTGRVVKTIIQDVQTQGFRIEGIAWDGRDDFGDQLAKGVYVYRVTVRNPDGDTAQEMQKMYLLK